MNVQGRDCALVIKTINHEMDVPYSEETIRSSFVLLEHNPGIEGDGKCKAICFSGGAAGCVVTSLNIRTAPLLFCLAFGEVRFSGYVSETRNLYKHTLDLVPSEETETFGLIQYRGNEKKYFASCYVKAFELRVLRGEALKLKLEITGKTTAAAFGEAAAAISCEERFHSDFVEYRINGKEYTNIYGLTLAVKKDKGTKTELWIKRVLERSADLPEVIDEFTVTAVLLRDKFEDRHFGKFCITLRRLFLQSDETCIETADAVIGPLRYFVSGDVTAEVFTSGEAVFP